MALTTLENTPITINLLSLVNDNGWSFVGGEAIHENCNAGTITHNDIFEANVAYDVSLLIRYINSGGITLGFGSESQSYTTAGLKTLTLNSTTANPQLSLTSDANVAVKILSLRKVATPINIDSNDTIVYAFKSGKWERFDNYYPDFGMSMFTNLYTFKDGSMYSHTDKTNRNNFYGTEYTSRIDMQWAQPKVVTYQSIKIEANELLITTTDGIVTSLGQVSDLIEQDFEQYFLDDGVTQLTVYDYEGNYYANFLRDKNTDINTGDRLKGRYITVKLTTTNQNDFKLFKVVLKYNISTLNE